MCAALTAVCIVVLVGIPSYVIWLAANFAAFLQPILIPVAIGVILAYLLDPLVTKLSQRPGLSRVKAILLLFVVAFLAIGALISYIVPTVSVQSANFARELPTYTTKARDLAVDLIYRYQKTFAPSDGVHTRASPSVGLVNWLLAPPSSPSPQASATPAPTAPPMVGGPSPAPAKLTSTDRQRIQDWVQKQLPNVEKQFPNIVDKAWGIVTKSIGGFLGVTGFLLSLVMVPIYLFFLLKERPAIEDRWREYLPLRNSPLKDEVATVLMQINYYVIAYFRGQLLVCLVDGLLIGTALLALGLNFAPLIGLLVVVLTMIPYLGIVLCWIPALIIAFAQSGSWQFPLVVTITFIVVQSLEATFYAPRIVGNSVGLHPMTVIVSIFVWGLLIGGLLGPILAIPLTATIKVLLARYVWGRRLREEVIENVAEVPVVRAEESVAER